MTNLKRKLITTALLASASAMAFAAPAMAVQMEGSVNVDNDFIVVVSKTNASGVTTNTKVYSGAHGRAWGKREDFKFDVPDDPTLRQCSVNVIAWGDRAVSQGFAGIFRGPDGVVYTGGPGIMGQASGITSSGWANGGGGPTASQIDTMMAASFPNVPYQVSGTVTGGTSPWGALNYTGKMSGVPSNQFKWIWPTSNQMTGQYSAFRLGGCDKFAKPKVVKPVHKPGEHFQCYMLKEGNNLKRETLYIRDQFGEGKAVLGKPVMLCNPSDKQHNRTTYKMRNAERHLVCYNYANEQPRVNKKVFINNQMAPDTVVAVKDELFCVPSSKVELDKVVPPTKFERTRPRRPQPRQQRR